MYFTVKVQPINKNEIALEDIISMTKTIYINHTEKSLVPKKSLQSYRKNRDNSGREPKMNCRKSAMATIITCHNYKWPGHKKKDCNRLNTRSDKSSNMDNWKRNGFHTIVLMATQRLLSAAVGVSKS